MENYKNEIKEEINKKWENELNQKINNIMLPKINKFYEDFSNHLNSITNLIIEKLENELMPEKNRKPARLVPLNNKESNKLITPILTCLSNIEAFMNLGFIKDKKIIMKNLNEKMNSNLFTPISKLMFKLWTTKESKCDLKEVDNQLKVLMKQDYKEDDPGAIITFILNKLNEEIYMNQYILKDQNTKGIIENNFFISAIITYKCKSFGNDSEPQKIMEKEKVLDLYITEPDTVTGIGKMDKTSFKDFSFMLIKDFDVRKRCEICQSTHLLGVGKIIDDTSNYLIINLNREKDTNRMMKFEYPEKFDFKDISKEDGKENSSYELISVIMDNKIDIVDNEEVMIDDEKIKIKTYSKNFNDNRWYLYIEGKISSVVNEKEIISTQNALILVYRKIKI